MNDDWLYKALEEQLKSMEEEWGRLVGKLRMDSL